METLEIGEYLHGGIVASSAALTDMRSQRFTKLYAIDGTEVWTMQQKDKMMSIVADNIEVCHVVERHIDHVLEKRHVSFKLRSQLLI